MEKPDQAEVRALLDQRLIEVSMLEGKLTADGRTVPARPVCFGENDLIAATGAADEHIKFLRAALDGPRRALSPPPVKTEAKATFPRDAYSPANIAATRTATEARVRGLEQLIRAKGGSAPHRPSFFGLEGDAGVVCATLDAHCISLERFCVKHGVTQSEIDAVCRDNQKTGEEIAKLPAPTKDESKKMTATEKCIAAKTEKSAGAKTEASAPTHKPVGATRKLLDLHGVKSLAELKQKLISQRGTYQ